MGEPVKEAAADAAKTTDKKAAAAGEDDKPQNPFFAKICAGDIVGVKQALQLKEASVGDLDEHGMTPLEHAAYRGNKEMCQLLLDMGAGVNEGKHSNGYTALHFAALSGKEQVCLLLLEKGAKTYCLNSVGRTAAQMAAFVGNHNCVSTINTFVAREDIEYYTVPHGIGNVPKLTRSLVTPVHQFVMQVNFHPVKVALAVKKSEALLGNLPEVIEVLSLMSSREMKKGAGAEANEIVAFKLHLLSHILSQLQKESSVAKDMDPIESFIRKMVRCSKAGGIPEKLDVLLREGVRSFPFLETTIMQQLVTSLTHTKIYEEPGAWGIICSTVNGQKGFRDNDPCTTCGEEKGAKKCGRCHYDAYCNKECQKLHWFVHKKYCKEKEVDYEMYKLKVKEQEEQAAAAAAAGEGNKEESEGKGSKSQSESNTNSEANKAEEEEGKPKEVSSEADTKSQGKGTGSEEAVAENESEPAGKEPIVS